MASTFEFWLRSITVGVYPDSYFSASIMQLYVSIKFNKKGRLTMDSAVNTR